MNEKTFEILNAKTVAEIRELRKPAAKGLRLAAEVHQSGRTKAGKWFRATKGMLSCVENGVGGTLTFQRATNKERHKALCRALEVHLWLVALTRGETCSLKEWEEL